MSIQDYKKKITNVAKSAATNNIVEVEVEVNLPPTVSLSLCRDSIWSS
jgi:hypothetical protein